MSNMNIVMLNGNLTGDAELLYTTSGYALCKFTLAVNERVKHGEEWVEEVSYVPCDLWGKKAENIVTYLTKGTNINVEGKMKQDRYETSEGKRSKMFVKVKEIQLFGSKDQKRSQTDDSFEQYAPPEKP